jgi:hypothetical protein
MTTRIALVSCGKLKLDTPAPAKDMYTSPLFKKARAYAETHYDRWFILSALHQVLTPDQVIRPYEMRMPSRRREQELWGLQTAGKLSCLMHKGCIVHSFAGEDYSGVNSHLQRLGFEVSAPMEGLQVGERLRWLNERLHAGLPALDGA